MKNRSQTQSSVAGDRGEGTQGPAKDSSPTRSSVPVLGPGQLPTMARTLSALAAVAIVLLSGVGHGLWTGRWTESVALERAVARLDRVPATVGDWRSQQAAALDPKVMQMAGFSGSLTRRYVNRHDGSQVAIVLVCGPPGPIATHPPEICMTGAGYEATAATAKVLAPYGSPGRAAEFKAVAFRKQGPTGSTPLNVFWSWGAKGSWTAPDYPRLTFARQPVLYKLYVSHQTARNEESLQGDPSLGFLRELLPALETSLFSAR
jgi:hypothetical protein